MSRWGQGAIEKAIRRLHEQGVRTITRLDVGCSNPAWRYQVRHLGLTLVTADQKTHRGCAQVYHIPDVLPPPKVPPMTAKRIELVEAAAEVPAQDKPWQAIRLPPELDQPIPNRVTGDWLRQKISRLRLQHA